MHIIYNPLYIDDFYFNLINCCSVQHYYISKLKNKLPQLKMVWFGYKYMSAFVILIAFYNFLFILNNYECARQTEMVLGDIILCKYNSKHQSYQLIFTLMASEMLLVRRNALWGLQNICMQVIMIVCTLECVLYFLVCLV